jgi:transcription elongation factor GreA
MGTLILRDSHRSLEKKMEDLDRLKDETAKRIKEAADQGDLKENAEYHAAREEQSLIIRKMQTLQSYSPFQIIEEGEIETDTVGFGNKVTILEEGKEEPEDYYLLGPIESEMDLFPLVVTVHSPFGQSIIGLEVGDDFTLDIRGVDTRFTITAIDKVSSE